MQLNSCRTSPCAVERTDWTFVCYGIC